MEAALPSYSADEPAIHKLVDDILAYIFLLNAAIPEHTTTVASSQVCTRWRSIALNCHTIWSRIIDYHRHPLKWIETLLDRSNPSLLDFGSRIESVYSSIMKNDVQDVLELVFNHIDKLRVFNVKLPVSSWELVCSRFLQLPAPNLEYVHVEATGHVTHPLFDNHAPNLQNLCLSNCTVDFTSSVLTSLTELYVQTNASASATVTVLEWLNILEGMPSLRWITLIHAISKAPANDICPVVHLRALDMLSVEGPLRESVTLVDHLIVPPSCGLRFNSYDVCLGPDQQRLWAIIEKKLDLWPKNALNRHLDASSAFYQYFGDHVAIGNLRGSGALVWSTGAVEVKKGLYTSGSGVDPVMSIELRAADDQMPVPLFLSLFALFERTFIDTTHLQLWIESASSAFLPLVDNFRRFVNLEKLSLAGDIATDFPFPLLQQANPVILPALKSMEFMDAEFYGTEPLRPIADFLQWRREQGFPIQKIKISQDLNIISREFVLAHIQDTVVEIIGE